MSQDKDTVASELAKAHYSIELGILRIVRLLSPDEAPPEEPIKLLEVNENTTAMGIHPVFFGANAGRNIRFPSVIVEVTPDEYEEIRQTPAKLPNRWSFGSELPRVGEPVSH